jgi:peptidoglycan/LPS O-acetylase OafA/YrhL
MLTTMGLISYSVYLWQEIFLGPHLRLWSVPALAVVAYASYRLIECPFLALKDLSSEQGATNAVPAAAAA